MKTHILLLLLLGGFILTIISKPARAAVSNLTNLPRGIRNNNPGNIERTNDQWRVWQLNKLTYVMWSLLSLGMDFGR